MLCKFCSGAPDFFTSKGAVVAECIYSNVVVVNQSFKLPVWVKLVI